MLCPDVAFAFFFFFFNSFIFLACRHQAILNLLLSSTECIVGHMGTVAGVHTARPIKINWEGFCHTSAAASQSCFHLQPPLREIKKTKKTKTKQSLWRASASKRCPASLFSASVISNMKVSSPSTERKPAIHPSGIYRFFEVLYNWRIPI